MNVATYDLHGVPAAEMQSEGIIIRTARDAAELTKELTRRGIKKLILHERNLCPEFWQPSNGIADGVLKHFADSSISLALVGTFDRRKAATLTALIQEKDLENQVSLSDSLETAKAQLSR
jgi:hypothetical protein